MILKSIRIKLLASILAVFCITGISEEESIHLKDLGIIAKITANIFSAEHFAKFPVDDKVSSQLFDEYFKTLDPNKIYLSAEDIKEFEPQRDKLDDQLKDGDVVFAFKVYARLLQRAEEYSKFSIDSIKKGLDFSKDDEFAPDRSKLPWAKNDEELRKLWELKTKNDVLYYRLVARADKEEQEKKKTEKIEKNNVPVKEDKSKGDANILSPTPKALAADDDKEKNRWIELSPEEKVLKRIDNNLTILKGNDELDIIELYLASLTNIYDPHSLYMSPKAVEDFNINMSLSLVGIGATLQLVDGYTKIMSLVPGGPADLDGHIEPNDRIIAVAQGDGEPVDIIDMPLSKVVRLIRGEEKTKVRLTVLKASKGLNSVPEIIEIIRNKVLLTQSEARGEIRETQTEKNGVKKIGVIYLPTFYCDFEAFRRGDVNCKSTTTDVRKIIADFKEKKVDAIILDLRTNPGGSLYEAVALTGLFIPSGPVVQVKNSAGGIIVQPDPDKNTVYDGPLAVMVNRLSASASEIFAAAIQDYSRGVLLGDSHTHGKGTVQTVLDLKDFTTYYNLNVQPGSVKITTQKFYRINGESTQIKGVSPDIVFPSYTDTMETGEKFLDHALPWDTIPAREYSVCENVKKIIPELAKKSQERVAQNKDFELLMKGIERYDRMKKEKTLSLNEEKRWKMYIEEKQLIDQQSALMKIEESDIEKNKDSKKLKDIYMDETVNVVTDLMEMKAPAFVSEAVSQ